jgi:hypothetical protein
MNFRNSGRLLRIYALRHCPSLGVEQPDGRCQIEIKRQDGILNHNQIARAASKLIGGQGDELEVFTLYETAPAFRWRGPPFRLVGRHAPRRAHLGATYLRSHRDGQARH